MASCLLSTTSGKSTYLLGIVKKHFQTKAPRRTGPGLPTNRQIQLAHPETRGRFQNRRRELYFPPRRTRHLEAACDYHNSLRPIESGVK